MSLRALFLLKWLLVLSVILHSPCGDALAQSLSPAEIARISQSVVRIGALDADGNLISAGSGTIVTPDGRIYTNQHVVEGAVDFEIYLLEDINEAAVLRYYARLEEEYPQLDFAVLQIDRDATRHSLAPASLHLPVVPLAADASQRGEAVFVFGYPELGSGFLVFTQGQITTVQNGIVGGQRVPVWYQTTADVSPGSSGGLAVNQGGEFIGIPTAVQVEDRTQGRLGGLLPLVAVRTLQRAAAQAVSPALAFPSGAGGLAFTCDGLAVENGIELRLRQIRPGYRYTVTVLGLQTYDPVLLVRETDRPERATCANDTPDLNVGFVLPHVGSARADAHSAQLTFQHRNAALSDVSLLIGSADSAPGDFVVIIEGLAVTAFDGSGDPLMVSITGGMINAGFLNVFMIGIEAALDPLLLLANEAVTEAFRDPAGSYVYCDNAGGRNCYGRSQRLTSARITAADGRDYVADEDDAALIMSLRAYEPQELVFLMSSWDETLGKYIAVFHLGTR